jgi:predicted flap endonuclease-1-like 5' DNA nuclease
VNNGKAPGAQSVATVVEPGATSYKLIVRLASGSPSQFVVDATDLTTGQSSQLVIVPTINPQAVDGSSSAALGHDVEDVEGIGPKRAEVLHNVGVHTVGDLLQAGSSPAGRRALAKKTRFAVAMILEWINKVDLSRVVGVGSEYSDLLEEAGVDTVPELAQRNAQNLYARLVEINAEKHLVRRLPTQDMVAAWIAHAKALPPRVTY